MMTTILVILEQTLLHLPLMLGAYISFSLLKVPDLSIESAYVVGAIFGGQMLPYTANMPAPIALLVVLFASLVGGSLVGIVSSVLTQKGKFPHLLSSIVTFGLFHGFNQLISAVYCSLGGLKNPLMQMRYIPQYPELITLFMIGLCCILFLYVLFRMQIGYCFAIYGNNPDFFENYGISTSYVFVLGIMLADAFAGMSGYLFAQSNCFIELNMGLSKALLCITALILGKRVIKIRKPITTLVPILGTLFYFILQQVLLKSGFNLKYFTAVQAFIVMCILLYTYRTKPYRMLNDNLGV